MFLQCCRCVYPHCSTRCGSSPSNSEGCPTPSSNDIEKCQSKVKSMLGYGKGRSNDATNQLHHIQLGELRHPQYPTNTTNQLIRRSCPRTWRKRDNTTSRCLGWCYRWVGPEESKLRACSLMSSETDTNQPTNTTTQSLAHWSANCDALGHAVE